jgi:uncharacterized membrane protein
MIAHQILLALHVLTAVLGVGPLLAMAIIASAEVNRVPHDTRSLVLLSRIIQWALVLMLATGGFLLQQTAWVYMHMAWFQVSFALFVFVGAALGMTNRPIRKAGKEPAPAALARVRLLAWICCALVGCIVVLMVTKPF